MLSKEKLQEKENDAREMAELLRITEKKDKKTIETVMLALRLGIEIGKASA